MTTKLPHLSRDTRGATTILVAVFLFALITLVGLIIDLGHIHVVRQELQNAADAGADAGAMSLFWLTGTQPVDAKNLLSCDYARLKAREVIQSNKSDAQALTIPEADVLVGVWQRNISTGAWEFQTLPCDSANAYTINAVRVITRRTNEVNGPVNMLFARFLGQEYVELTARATAVLGWVRNLRRGGGFPLAVADTYVPPPGQSVFVSFNPDNRDTGGWHSYLHPAASSEYIQNLVNGTEKSDPIKVGDLIEMINGVATSVLQECAKEFRARDNKWTVMIPVVPSTQTLNQQAEVLGFVAFEITDIKASPDHRIDGWIRGGYLAPKGETGSPVGSPTSGLRASLPKLVE